MAATPEALSEVFQDEFGRIASTVMSDVTIEVSRLNGKPRRFWRVVPDKKVFDAPTVSNNSFRFRSARFKTISRKPICWTW